MDGRNPASGDASGGSLGFDDGAYFDSGADMLRIQLVVELMPKFQVVDNENCLRVYTDSSYDSMYEIPNAITSVMFMSNGIEITLVR